VQNLTTRLCTELDGWHNYLFGWVFCSCLELIPIYFCSIEKQAILLMENFKAGSNPSQEQTSTKQNRVNFLSGRRESLMALKLTTDIHPSSKSQMR